MRRRTGSRTTCSGRTCTPRRRPAPGSCRRRCGSRRHRCLLRRRSRGEGRTHCLRTRRPRTWRARRASAARRGVRGRRGGRRRASQRLERLPGRRGSAETLQGTAHPMGRPYRLESLSLRAHHRRSPGGATTVLCELRILASKELDSKQLLCVVFAGDARLPERLRSQELLPLGSRIRRRLASTTPPATSCSPASTTCSPLPETPRS